MKSVDIRGDRNGRVVAIEPTSRRRGGIIWRCACDCGNTVYVTAGDFRIGKPQSCGCIGSEKTIARNVAKATHRMTNDPTYRTWTEMKRRCSATERDNSVVYANVSVCERWMESFENFFADMGVRPEGKTLDRWPDRTGNYEPTNCRWATPTEQSSNRAGNVYVDLHKEKVTIAEAARRLGKSPCGVKHMLKDGRLSLWDAA